MVSGQPADHLPAELTALQAEFQQRREKITRQIQDLPVEERLQKMRQIKKEIDLLAEHMDSELEDIDMLFARFGLVSSEAKQLRKALVDHGLEHSRLQRDDQLLLNGTRDAYYRAHIEELSGIDMETKIACLVDQVFSLHLQLLDSYQIRFSIDQQMRPGDDFIRGTVDFTPTLEGSIYTTESHRDFN